MNNMADNNWEVVYHYTSLDGFNRILSSGSLALTDITKSNDPAEGFYALQMLKEAYCKLYHDEEIDDKTYHQFHKAFFEFSEGEQSFGRLKQVVLSISFCEPDLPLALWRTYGDNGRGVAIGVSKKYLSQKAESEGFTFKPVEYVSEKEMIERYCKFWKRHIDINEISIGDDLRKEYIEGYFIKRPENHYESEWRLIYTGLNLEKYTILAPDVPDEICSYMREDDVVLYYKLIINENDRVIDYVYTGPQCKITDNEMRLLLKKNKIKYCSVCHDNTVMR